MAAARWIATLSFFLSLSAFAENDYVASCERRNAPCRKSKDSSPDLGLKDPDCKEPAVQSSSKELSSKIQIGANYTYAWIKPSDEERSHGSLGGAQAMYEYKPPNRFYGGVKLSYRQGDTECSEAKRSLLYIDLQERLGYTFYWAEQDDLLTLFSGVGYRYLRQHIRPKVVDEESFAGSFFPPFLTDATDVLLKYNEIYIPVGFIADFAINRFTSIGLCLTWMGQLFPTVDIKPLGNAFWALSNTWKNFLVEVPITFTLTQEPSCLLTLKPTYEYWQDGHSKAKTSTGIPLGLPGNTYQFVGVDLNLAYVF